MILLLNYQTHFWKIPIRLWIADNYSAENAAALKKTFLGRSRRGYSNTQQDRELGKRNYEQERNGIGVGHKAAAEILQVFGRAHESGGVEDILGRACENDEGHGLADKAGSQLLRRLRTAGLRLPRGGAA